MVRLSTHDDFEVRGAHDRPHDAKARTFLLEDRALFDVELDKGVDVAADRLRDVRGIETHPPHGVGHRDAVGVARARGFIGLDAVGDRARAPEVGVEAASLLFADRDGLEDAQRPTELRDQAGDRLDRGDDAERAVEGAAAAHRVDVRAGHDGATAARSLDASPDVADGVAAHEQTGLLHPARDELRRGDPRCCVQRAVEPAAG